MGPLPGAPNPFLTIVVMMVIRMLVHYTGAKAGGDDQPHQKEF
jgi:hypothetical protein